MTSGICKTTGEPEMNGGSGGGRVGIEGRGENIESRNGGKG